jgi:RNA recognition motif-containing protein
MQNRLFIRNLAPSMNLGMLADMLESVGDVESSDFGDPIPETGLQSAYVQMRTDEAAKDCIDRFNGQVCEGYRLIVTYDRPHQPDPTFKASKKKR